MFGQSALLFALPVFSMAGLGFLDAPWEGDGHGDGRVRETPPNVQALAAAARSQGQCGADLRSLEEGVCKFGFGSASWVNLSLRLLIAPRIGHHNRAN